MNQRPVNIDDPARVYRRLLGYARPHAGMFAIGVLGMALFAATDSALAYLVKFFLGGAFVEPDPRVVWMVPLGAVLLFLIRGIGDSPSTGFHATEGPIGSSGRQASNNAECTAACIHGGRRRTTRSA